MSYSGRRIWQLAKARAAVAATAGEKSEPKSTEISAEEYGERMEAQKVEIRIEAQIRAAGEEEEAIYRATARRRRRRSRSLLLTSFSHFIRSSIKRLSNLTLIDIRGD